MAWSDNTSANLLSRLPLPETPAQVLEPGVTALLMEALDSSLDIAAHIKAGTANHSVFVQVHDMILQGMAIPSTRVQALIYKT